MGKWYYTYMCVLPICFLFAFSSSFFMDLVCSLPLLYSTQHSQIWIMLLYVRTEIMLQVTHSVMIRFSCSLDSSTAFMVHIIVIYLVFIFIFCATVFIQPIILYGWNGKLTGYTVLLTIFRLDVNYYCC